MVRKERESRNREFAVIGFEFKRLLFQLVHDLVWGRAEAPKLRRCRAGIGEVRLACVVPARAVLFEPIMQRYITGPVFLGWVRLEVVRLRKKFDYSCRVVVRCIQVYELANALRKAHREMCEFDTAEGMTNQRSTLDFQSVQKLAKVIYQSIPVVTRFGFIGFAESAASQCKDAKLVCEFRRNGIKDVR